MPPVPVKVAEFLLSRIFQLVLAGYLIFALSTTAWAAPSPVLELKGTTSAAQLKGHVDYYLDPQWAQDLPDMHDNMALEFKPVDRIEPDFGYTKSKIWLRFRVRNDNSEEDKWKLHFHENFKQVIDVYVVPDAGPRQHSLSLSQTSGFRDRPVAYPEMVAPISLDPGKQATVYIAYWSEGSSGISFSLETADSFSINAAQRVAKNFIYYGMMAILIGIAFIAFLLLKRPVFLAYIAYAGSTLLYLMQSDGVAFQYLWPNWPGFNSYATIAIGSALIMAAANYARVFLATKINHPIFDKLLFALITITAIMGVSGIFFDPQVVKQTLVLMSLVAAGLCTVSGIQAARTRFKEVRFYVLAWVGIVMAAGVMNLRHIFNVQISQDLQFDIMRFAMVLDAAMMGLAIADRYNQLRQSRQLALQESLSEAERNLHLNRRLQELEEQYSLAAELAQSRAEHIKDTVHDLKQPLHALRLNVQNLMNSEKQSQPDSQAMEETFSYLESLIADQLQETMQASISDFDTQKTDHDRRLELNDVLEQIYEMFLPDAQEKQLRFSFVPTTQTAAVEPLPLMRIITNLVANAIKYTQHGKILLGVRTVAGRLHVEIHDSGLGMTSEEFDAAKRRSVRLAAEGNGADGNQPEGNGYGLAIVHELAEKYNIEISRSEARQNGTGIIVALPS